MDMEDDFGLPERKSDNSTQSEEKGATEGRFQCFLYTVFFFYLDKPKTISWVFRSVGITSGSYKSESKWHAESGSRTEEVKELSRSKWSNVEEDETENSQSVRRNSKSLPKSSQERQRKGKSVWWGDKVYTSVLFHWVSRSSVSFASMFLSSENIWYMLFYFCG